ncbi:MAG: helix-hairpin-helix domain-containing protein [Acidobacteriia bacterium]|jgi:competence protein ComEA|nr:helix-hairpin-helix domain-containing protein [Terriglobia bacterium]
MHVNPVASRCLVAGILSIFLVAAASPARAAPPPAASRSAAAKAVPTAPVDVNTASAAQLETVPGIGKALAQRIVEFREKNGPFGEVDDLVKVRGIGEKSIQRLKPYLTAGPAKAR